MMDGSAPPGRARRAPPSRDVAAAAAGLDGGAHDAHTAAMPILVRPATVADAPRLSQLGATTFRETFAAENTPEDMAHYLAESFTPERQAAEITDPAGAVLLAERRGTRGDADDAEDAELVGYAHLVSGPAPAAVQGPAPLELKRLYVARAWHGRGVAQALMDAALDVARTRGAQTVWLGVWERNPRAVAFYAKYGFARVGEHSFVLGADRQTDWVLARPLGDAPRSDRAGTGG
jgi:ribosomal protein S18 acetylase RimI-like enzyme